MKTRALIAIAVAVIGCKRPIETVDVDRDPDAALVAVAIDAAPIDASPPDAGPPDAAPPLSYLKGSTHVHTIHSGDSGTSPEEVAKWYEDHGYDFIVITDHNRVTDFSRAGELLVLPGIELTNNPPKCDPAPPEPKGKCRIHVNSLFVSVFDGYADGTRPPKIDWRERRSIKRVDLYQAAITQSIKLGGLPQLNHPTWHWGTNGRLLAQLGKRGMVLFEVANMAFAPWNTGTDKYSGTEAIWDEALDRRVLVFGVASDDAHHYTAEQLERRKQEGKSLYPAGGGWVMVRAEKNAISIRTALTRGDFYATTGVVLSDVSRSEDAYVVAVAGESLGKHVITLIGPGGAELETIEGRQASFDLTERIGWVRVRVRADSGAMAWTQPILLPTSRPEK